MTVDPHEDTKFRFTWRILFDNELDDLRERGALDLRDMLNVLNGSRVAQLLLLDESSEWSGKRAAEGLFYPPDETPPGESTLVEEHRTGERMIERALDIDAEVIVLDRKASEVLADVDGVRAILRW
ncbi:hypothetical protein ABZ260_46035 [Streptosporangium sp. NPDC006013]|uniref:hypothetical protein n=1 Tax=Streptosporangium sp. NPDC006013 TaxID=3155596 RepID=UPI0033AF93FD